MNGFELFCQYQAIKLHFTSPSYCYFKYNGKASATPKSFEARKDKYSFHKLARNLQDHEVTGFLVSNFLHDPKTWTQDLLTTEANERYLEWRRKYESLSYLFSQDLIKIFDRITNPKLIFKTTEDGKLPVIWTMMNQNDIMFETMVILHGLTGVLDSWDQKYKDDYIYNKKSMLIRKYEPFLNLDVSKMKECFKHIAEKYLTST